MQNRKTSRKNAKKRRAGITRTVVSFGVVMAALVAVIVVPSPYAKPMGGVVLYGEDKEVEVFGPKLPETIVGGYTQPVIQSVVLPEKGEEESETIYVYASENQKNYHLGTCKFAYASGSELTLYEAHFLGYTPGKCCDAPAYEG